MFENIKFYENTLNLLRFKMSGEEELLCYNRGCGQRYLESGNTEGEELICISYF